MAKRIVLPGEPEQPEGPLFCPSLWVAEARRMVRRAKQWEAVKRVNELRRSCGVEQERTGTVEVRLPPRYE